MNHQFLAIFLFRFCYAQHLPQADSASKNAFFVDIVDVVSGDQNIPILLESPLVELGYFAGENYSFFFGKFAHYFRLFT